MTTEAIDIEALVTDMAREGREASLTLANVPSEKKNQAILRLAELIEENTDSLRAENAKDLAAAEENGITPSMLKRLELSDRMLSDMLVGAKQVAELLDPLGESLESHRHPPRLPHRKSTRTHRRHWNHLRIAPKRHHRLRHPLPQIRQRRHPAWR